MQVALLGNFLIERLLLLQTLQTVGLRHDYRSNQSSRDGLHPAHNRIEWAKLSGAEAHGGHSFKLLDVE
jgi:hypothetical protein